MDQAEGISARIPSSPARITALLALISVFGLFLELMLIRWVSTEIRIFAYLQNTVLVVCFLGLGMGCWDSRRRPFALADVLIPLCVLVGLLAFPVSREVLGRISTLLSGFGGLVIWDDVQVSPTEALVNSSVGATMTFGLMYLLWSMFVPVGRLLGGLLDAHPRPIWAYSVNVAGSLVGIWLFVGLSAMRFPPVLWFAVLAALALPFLGRARGKLEMGLLVVIVGLGALAGWEPGWKEVYWSPYQKLAIRPTPLGESPHEIGVCQIMVNNNSYQEIVDLRPATVDSRPDLFPPALRGLSQYDLPPRLHPSLKNVLIVGAGSGNDVTGALRNGAERVVAVEIDPVIIDVGRRYNPEQPYADPRVTIVNDDARSYFATTTEKFDLIIFGLLDSHTTTSMTNARLDHYVYTQESLTHAKSLLKPGGVISLAFYPQRWFLIDRMNNTLAAVFGQEPLHFLVESSQYGRGAAILVVGDLAGVERQFAADPQLAQRIHQLQKQYPIPLTGTSRPATDDWPYIYLERPMIPVLYFLLAVVLVLLFWAGLRTLAAPHFFRDWNRTDTHFFFLGAAFMLLEVQNVSKAAVVLGNTWTVNAVIISGVLAMILLANTIAAAFPRLPIGLAYFGLLLSCLGLYFTDLAAYAFLPYYTKAIIVGLLTSLPMLFSGMVFIRSFADTPRKDQALGANLFGSLIGGLLQSITFLTGIKSLLLIVTVLYLVALLTRPRSSPISSERTAEAAV